MNAPALLIDLATGRQYPLRGDGPHLVGRSADAAVPVTDPDCSRRHFTIACVAGHHVIEPLTPQNPTYADGKPLQGKTLLLDNVVLQIGSTELRFSRSAAPSPAREEARGLVLWPFLLFGSVAAILAAAGVRHGLGVERLADSALADDSVPLSPKTLTPNKAAVASPLEPVPQLLIAPEAIASAAPPPAPTTPVYKSAAFRSNREAIVADLGKCELEFNRMADSSQLQITRAPSDTAASQQRVVDLIAVQSGETPCDGAYPVLVELAFPHRFAKAVATQQWAKEDALNQSKVKTYRSEIQRRRDQTPAEQQRLDENIDRARTPREYRVAEVVRQGLPSQDAPDERIAKYYGIEVPRLTEKGNLPVLLGTLNLTLVVKDGDQPPVEVRKLAQKSLRQSFSAISNTPRDVLPYRDPSQMADRLTPEQLGRLASGSTAWIVGTFDFGGGALVTFSKPIPQSTKVPLTVKAVGDDTGALAAALDAYIGTICPPSSQRNGPTAEVTRMRERLMRHAAVLQADSAAGTAAGASEAGHPQSAELSAIITLQKAVLDLIAKLEALR